LKFYFFPRIFSLYTCSFSVYSRKYQRDSEK